MSGEPRRWTLTCHDWTMTSGESGYTIECDEGPHIDQPVVVREASTTNADIRAVYDWVRANCPTTGVGLARVADMQAAKDICALVLDQKQDHDLGPLCAESSGV